MIGAPQLIDHHKNLLAAIPPAEQALETLTAERFLTVGTATGDLEGLCFDRAGDLFFTAIQTGRIYKLDMKTMHLRVFKELGGDVRPCALKIHRDGRLFVACADSNEGGKVLVLSPEGEDLATVAQGGGYIIDDLVFDSEGGFYFTDLAGSTANPNGGVYYVDPMFEHVKPVLKGLNGANGVALSPAGDMLWVTEHGANKLHAVKLGTDHVSIPFSSSSVAYYFCGWEGPDSCSVDSEGNLYVALFRQGRYLVFNAMGVPVRQILIPERAEGRMLLTTHPMLRPGTRELFLTASDEATHETALYVSEGLAPAYTSFQFQ